MIRNNGFLFVSKPKNITSSNLVLQLKKKLNIKKIGHTGTLDFAATGLMILPINQFTCFTDRLQGFDKSYLVSILPGTSTDSGDLEGNVIEKWDLKNIQDFIFNNNSTIEEKMNNILKWRSQVPPKISALKLNGKRYSDLYRNNINFEVQSREIKVSKIEINCITEFEIQFSILVSSGTYIRKIVQDLGEELGIPLVVRELKRLTIGKFKLENADDFENIKMDKFPTLHSLDEVYPIPGIEVGENLIKKIKNGGIVDLNIVEGEFLMKHNSDILAWCQSDPSKNGYKYLKVF